MGSLPLDLNQTSMLSFVQCADGSTASITKTDPMSSVNTQAKKTVEENTMFTSSGMKILTVADLATSFATNSDLDSGQEDSSALIMPMRTYTRSENVWSK